MQPVTSSGSLNKLNTSALFFLLRSAAVDKATTDLCCSWGPTSLLFGKIGDVVGNFHAIFTTLSIPVSGCKHYVSA